MLILHKSGSVYQLKDTIISKLIFRDLIKSRMKHRAFSLACATERTKMIDSDRKDFYYYLMEAKDSSTGEKLSLQETWAESNTLIAAGADTTSLVLAGTFFYLTRNPEALRKVQAEVRGVFSGKDVEDIKAGADLNSCKYLKACLDETMRMTPPTPGMLPRTVLPGGINIDGHHILENVEVGTPFYALFHNPAYFPDSFSYHPERWLLSDDASEEAKRDFQVANQAFAPFSIGPRACIGKNMAYMEMMIVMARVLFLFDFSSEGGEEGGEYVVKDHFVCGKDGPMISFSSLGK
jgi:cytochrome P450